MCLLERIELRLFAQTTPAVAELIWYSLRTLRSRSGISTEAEMRESEGSFQARVSHFRQRHAKYTTRTMNAHAVHFEELICTFS
jgi:hypothetical protein